MKRSPIKRKTPMRRGSLKSAASRSAAIAIVDFDSDQPTRELTVVEQRAVDAGPRAVGPAIEKGARIVSERYLGAVRELACAFCGKDGPSEPHHYPPIGRQQRRCDLLTTPACREHHDKAQQYRIAREVQAAAVHATQALLFERRGALWWLGVMREIAAGME